MKLIEKLRRNHFIHNYLDIFGMGAAVFVWYMLARFWLGLTVSPVEFFGVTMTIVSIGLIRKQNIYGLVIALASTATMGFFFWSIGLIYHMYTSAVYFALNIVTIWNWTHKRPEKKSFIPSRMPLWITVSFLVVIFAVGLYEWIMKGTLAGLGFIYMAMAMGGKVFMIWKKVESWAFWIIAGLINFILFTMTGAYMSLFRQMISLANNIVAYVKWSRQIGKDNS